MHRPRLRPPFWGTLGLISLALAFTACSSAAPAPSPTPDAPQQPSPGQPQPPVTQQIKRGGTINVTANASWAGSDPAMGQNAYQSWYYFGTYMLRRTPDSWKLEGDAIEKWEYSPNGMELTLKVRPGVKWQNKAPTNGREVEAKDIVYTLKSITGQQYPEMPPLRFPRRSSLEDMADAVAVDKSTVKVTMKNPSATFLDGMAEYRSPLTPDGIREHFGGVDSLATPNPDRYLSAGPFTFTKFQDNTEALFARYPDYWEKGPDGQSKPYLDTVRILWVLDAGTQIAAVVSGQLSMLGVTNPETRNQIISTRKDIQIIEHQPTSLWYHMAFNTRRKPFDDVRVRQALALALDPVETGKAMFGEWNGKASWRYPSPLPWPFPEALSQEEVQKHPWSESPKRQATIDKARALLAEAGLADGFSFEMLSASTPAMNDALAIKTAQIRKMFPNVNIKLMSVDNAIHLERSAKGEFDARMYGYIHETTAVAMMKTVYHSKGGRNVSGLADARMDELLDRAGRELDEAKRKELLREAQLRAYEIASFVPTTHNITQTAFQPELRGMRMGGGTSGFQIYLKEVWMDK